ncbi:microcystin-dependent protein [Lutibacter sp. Hel_I_33_5]|uniref:phage tail protein n=1 Tax=Lutibacter sp. Hel_I_33_5 TaxID=1566289 RepID=UPI00119F3FBC|nr:tail fiber protein [Lutibacter sp. Hel_I_33_5]TVZ56583.1 microcystin-dependent protein [Lutibacter sp. Hel_I_33_5]
MEPSFIGSIILFAGDFPIRNWAKCEGQLLSIASNTALFSIIGTTYGGDGRTTFALPDLRGRVPVGTGAGPGLIEIPIGQKVGRDKTTLAIPNIPAHKHTATVSDINATAEATVSIPATGSVANTYEPGNNAIFGAGEVISGKNEINMYSSAAANKTLKPFTAPVAITATGGNVAVGTTGSNTPFSNIQPSLGMTYLICLQGIYPSRN